MPAIASDPLPCPAPHALHVPCQHAHCPTGLYTEHKLQEWQHLQAEPALHPIVTTDLAQGGCHEWGSCPLASIPGGPQYSITGLEHQLIAAVNSNWKHSPILCHGIISYSIRDQGGRYRIKPCLSTSCTTEIRQEIHMGGVSLDQGQDAPLPGGYNNLSPSGTEVDQKNSFNVMKKFIFNHIY